MKFRKLLRPAVIAAATVCVVSTASAETILKASHQWPGGKGDIRDEMVRVVAREVEKADVGLKIRIYPAQSLFKAKEQWGALVRGRLDMTALPLDYASGRHPEFSATLMPGLVRNHERAERLNDSKFMSMIKDVIEKGGAKVIADAWLAGAFASKKECITDPASVKGQVIRAAGPAFERMLAGAGGSIASMSSAEIYTAMQTGVLDAANTSSGSFISYRIYEQVKCLTKPGKNALWFMYEPILVSMKTWNRLTPEQQDALMAAGKKSQEYFSEKAADLDQKLVDVYREHGVKIAEMSDEDYKAWMDIAEKTSFKHFIDEVPNGAALIKAARDVQ
ncbi:MAG TPA: TRAP transporter substrate-binding protein DctP [Gammaproteobacteria bacterium]|nr:TRAP transporter substrate-binding protein DctP [Gammaproteobacteria bacterium]